jgi:hypothetical protein
LYKAACLFREAIRLKTYGDDHAATVKAVYSNFNHLSLQKHLAEKGILLVPADKDKKEFDAPFIDKSQVTFLKRRFVSYKGRVCCPIEMQTIYKMLSMYVDEGTLTPEEHTFAAADEAMDELVQHGEEEYLRWEPLVKKALLEAGIFQELDGFQLRWDKLEDRY